MRFVVKPVDFGTAQEPRFLLTVVDTKDGDDLIFGDNQPRDEREAKQCARAANAAVGIVLEEIRRKLYNLTIP